MADRGELERSANRMHLVSRWADDLAHEIKNPLHAMVINLELVKRRAAGGDGESVVERAEIVEAELQRVHGLVDSLLRVIRPWPGEALADADRIVTVLLPVVTARARIRKLDYDHQPGSAPVQMAPADLALVLLNLIDNAIEATGEGGELVTRCESTRERVTITVEDTGVGLPADLGDRLREAGVSTREGHEGLGLAVVERLIREAGGTLALEDRDQGTGAVATVVLRRPPSA